MYISEQDLAELMNPQSRKGIGGWGSTDSFSTQAEALDSLGITSGFRGYKPNGVQYQIELEATSPFRILEGTAASIKGLSGGANQTFFDIIPQLRRDYLKLISVKPLPHH